MDAVTHASGVDQDFTDAAWPRQCELRPYQRRCRPSAAVSCKHCKYRWIAESNTVRVALPRSLAPIVTNRDNVTILRPVREQEHRTDLGGRCCQPDSP